MVKDLINRENNRPAGEIRGELMDYCELCLGTRPHGLTDEQLLNEAGVYAERNGDLEIREKISELARLIEEIGMGF